MSIETLLTDLIAAVRENTAALRNTTPDVGTDSAEPVKRGRGRPPKNEAPAPAQLPAAAPAAAPASVPLPAQVAAPIAAAASTASASELVECPSLGTMVPRPLKPVCDVAVAISTHKNLGRDHLVELTKRHGGPSCVKAMNLPPEKYDAFVAEGQALIAQANAGGAVKAGPSLI